MVVILTTIVLMVVGIPGELPNFLGESNNGNKNRAVFPDLIVHEVWVGNITRWWCFQDFLMFTPGEMIQFDYYYFLNWVETTNFEKSFGWIQSGNLLGWCYRAWNPVLKKTWEPWFTLWLLL